MKSTSLATIGLLLLVPAAFAHEDDPKVLATQPPLAGPGKMRLLPDGSPVVQRDGLQQFGPESSFGSLGGALPAFAANNVSLLSWLTLGDLGGYSTGNDCWGYTSPSGREYAIMGVNSATVWVEITNPTNPTIVGTVNGPDSLWHDVKVFEDHAYVVSEGGQGIQVVDMSNIDGGVVNYLGDITTGGTSATHNVAIDEDSGFLYRTGGGSDGLRFYDLNQSKSSPPYVGEWPDYYVHDAQIYTYSSGPFAGKQIAFTCSGLNGGGTSTGMRIVDVTDKSNPLLLDTVFWSGAAYSHQGWLSDDLQYFYVNDELDEPSKLTTTYVIDVSDINNAFLANTFDNGNSAIGHNLYVRGDLMFEANYRSGMRVFDLSVDPLDPPETAYFDTYEADDDAQFNGLWSLFPYFPSGIVIGSDKEAGLFVFWVGEQLVDLAFTSTLPTMISASGATLGVTITEANAGDLVAGTETLHYNDGTGWQMSSLQNLGMGNYNAQLPALPCGTAVSFYVSAQSTNGIVWTEPEGGPNAAATTVVATSETIVFNDDFETDPGWLVTNLGATTGDWERGVPVDDPSWDYDPESDSDGSGQCWLTENAIGNTDVDDGATRLRSVDLDMSASGSTLSYDYYLNLTDTGDALVVEANDQVGSGWQEVARHDTSGGTSWRTHTLNAADFSAAGVALNNTFRIRFEVNDGDPQSIVEAGIDALIIKTLSCDTVASYCTPGTSASGCQATLSGTGTPSLSMASGFDVAAASVEGNKKGIFFFGQNGQQANPWGNGSSFQCVTPPVFRTSVQSSGGTDGQCDGAFNLDFNAYITANPNKAPTAGIPSQMQLWYRDPANTSNQTTSLSDALEFTTAP